LIGETILTRMRMNRERFGNDAVRAQLDLPDVFENLAGHHAGGNDEG